MFPTMNADPPIPPPPMSRSEARAAGLKTFTAVLACHRCGSKQRMVHAGACYGCKEVEQRKRKALAEKVRKQVRARVLVSARSQVLRELDREARAAVKAAEKAAKAKEREAAKLEVEKQRKAEARAVARATRHAAAAIEQPATDAQDLPPWGTPAGADCEAPWD